MYVHPIVYLHSNNNCNSLKNKVQKKIWKTLPINIWLNQFVLLDHCIKYLRFVNLLTDYWI